MSTEGDLNNWPSVSFEERKVRISETGKPRDRSRRTVRQTARADE